MSGYHDCDNGRMDTVTILANQAIINACRNHPNPFAQELLDDLQATDEEGEGEEDEFAEDYYLFIESEPK